MAVDCNLGESLNDMIGLEQTDARQRMANQISLRGLWGVGVSLRNPLFEILEPLGIFCRSTIFRESQ